jgi:hypothetical protein
MSEDSDHSLFGLVGLLDDSEVARVRERAAAFRECIDEHIEDG